MRTDVPNMNIDKPPLALSRFRWHILLAFFVIGYVAISLRLLHPSYETHDNFTILRNAIDGYVVDYAGTLLTSFWSLLYGVAPSVPWYGLTLYAMHALSIYIWLQALGRSFKPFWLKALVALIFLAYYQHTLVRLDYTSTGAMLCLAAITWACLDIVESRSNAWRFVAAGIAFMMGMLARPQAGWGALAYGFPVALIAILGSLPDWKKPGTDSSTSNVSRHPESAARLHGTIVAALLFLAPAVLNGLVNASYRHVTMTPVQAQYDAFETLRVKLARMSRRRKRQIISNSSVLKSIGWKRHDAFEYFGFEYYDERKYNSANLQVLWDHYHRDLPPTGMVTRTLRERFSLWPGMFLLLASVPLFMAVSLRRRYLGILGMALPIYCLSLSSVMYLFVIFQYRTELPFTLGFGFASLLVAGRLTLHDAVNRRYLIAACVSAAVLLPGAYMLLADDVDSLDSRVILMKNEEQKLDWLNQNAKGAVIFAKSNGLRLESLSPLDSSRQDFDAFSLGWDTFSPDFYHRISALGITQGYQIPDALVDKPNVYMLGPEGWCSEVANMVASPYSIQASDVHVFADQTILCRLSKAPIGPAAPLTLVFRPTPPSK
ncbi:MAG TPA: hypothetical protein VGH91_03460 [Gammaproteobacteria bacterium]|jgi:hypothetical protein